MLTIRVTVVHPIALVVRIVERIDDQPHLVDAASGHRDAGVLANGGASPSHSGKWAGDIASIFPSRMSASPVSTPAARTRTMTWPVAGSGIGMSAM